MIAPAEIPKTLRDWNRQWHAPWGRRLRLPPPLRFSRIELRLQGPFAHQPNNSTRAFEFPWAYETITRLSPGRDLLEIGGGFSGLQFVLAREGYRVTNVDPGQPEHGWKMTRDHHARLAEVFRAPVALKPTTIADAGIPDRSVDVLVCISALEHFPDEALREFAEHAPRILRPNGIAVLTVDLFTDLEPFTNVGENKYGRNIDVRQLLERSSLQIVEGNREEIYGFPEFTPATIMANRAKYLVGTGYPTMAQCLVCRPA